MNSAPAMPAAVGELVIARMRSGKTTPEAVLPRVETNWPLQSSMKSRLRRREGSGAPGGCSGGADVDTSTRLMLAHLSAVYPRLADVAVQGDGYRHGEEAGRESSHRRRH